jgi:predicted metalloprotease
MANWNRISRQGNVVDRRGMAAGGLGIVGTIAVVGISMLLGVNPADVLGQLEQQGAFSTTTENAEEFAGTDAYEQFSQQVVGSLDGYWEQHLSDYQPATLVLFRNRTTSACGGALSLVGPHYCPLDQQIYLDERFFEELQGRLGAGGGDVAEAYVIAHEVGHHVQNLLGRLSENASTEESVTTELAADCLAGAWLGSLQTEDIYEANEVSEAIDAASAVGDDNIQKRTQGTIQPETWTHGSSTQRKQSVMLGFQNADDPSVCLQQELL